MFDPQKPHEKVTKKIEKVLNNYLWERFFYGRCLLKVANMLMAKLCVKPKWMHRMIYFFTMCVRATPVIIFLVYEIRYGCRRF